MPRAKAMASRSLANRLLIVIVTLFANGGNWIGCGSAFNAGPPIIRG